MDSRIERRQKLIQSIQKAQQNLVNFRHILLVNGPDEVESADFHYKWSDRLLNGSGHEAIEGFRESAKTNYILRSFLLYALTFPSAKYDYIVVIKKNTTLARKVLRETEREAETNPAISANCKERLEQSADVYSVDRISEDGGEVMNVRIEVYGKGAAIRGLANRDRRPKIVVVDDPQDVDEAKSIAVQESDWNWFLSDVMFLGQRTRIFLIGNNLGEKCIIERVFANAKQLGFETMKVPTMIEGRSAWPAKYTLEAIEKEKEAYRNMGKIDVWLREKMCEAVSEETQIFKREDYRYYVPNIVMKIAAESLRWATLDPASSKEDTASYRAIVVNLVDSKGFWFIADVPYGRWDSAELMDRIFDTVVAWRLTNFGIEKGIFKQVIEPFIYKEMSKRKVFFNVIELEHAKQGSKLERIKMLQPRFKAHTIFFPERASWLAEMEAELAGVTKDGIKSLYIDLVDALAMQEQIAKAPLEQTDDINKQLPRTAMPDNTDLRTVVSPSYQPIQRLPRTAMPSQTPI